jgi:heme oxygenase
MEQRTEHHPSQGLPSARASLRSATRAAHERMEAGLQLISPDLTRGEYIATLRRFLAVHTVLDRELEVHVAELRRLGFEWELRGKVSLLRRDLDVLGSSPCSLDQAARLPSLLPTAFHALGALYVIEGSTLGGMVISRHLERALRIGPADGASFFYGQGAATGARWKQLCGLLERRLADPRSLEQAVSGANTTFSLFVEGVAK